MTREISCKTGNNCTNCHNFRVTMSNQVNVCNLVVPKARRTGELSWTTWLSLTTRGEQQGMTDLLQRWGKREGEAWASAILRYNNTAEPQKPTSPLPSSPTAATSQPSLVAPPLLSRTARWSMTVPPSSVPLAPPSYKHSFGLTWCF